MPLLVMWFGASYVICFLILIGDNKITYPVGLLWAVNETEHVKHLFHYLAYGNLINNW